MDEEPRNDRALCPRDPATASDGAVCLSHCRSDWVRPHTRHPSLPGVETHVCDSFAKRTVVLIS